MKKKHYIWTKITIILIMLFSFINHSCVKDEATDSSTNKEFRCGTTLPIGYQCISFGGESAPTTYDIPELIGYWDENISDFCIQYKSDGTGVITFKASAFTKATTQRIKWGALITSKGAVETSNTGIIRIVHQSLEGSLDPQIALLAFKRSTKEWYGYDLKRVAACGTGNSGNGGSDGNGSGNTNAYPSGSGAISFWTKTDLGCGNITVSIGGQSKLISQYFGTMPNCGADGTATFILPAGNYTFSGSCVNITWNSTVTISAGVCTRMQLTSNKK
ncbi:hypothetical protein [Sphingobacterium yanglingense]|uniref:Uncharacterized protein n=1 Tax=Sphingobacterium yanglingense TaxID=1437280 RepID=A0A4R6WIN7_9SPHI|nr:hypothetical protein [Sphingobacterium yanglingense]TDQ80150.1 hypothetical protein CLV99_1605 [Sphingobacterium yanglingense]